MNTTTMTARATEEAMRIALTAARRGDVATARQIGEQALLGDPQSPQLHAMLGMLCCRIGDFAAGASHLRQAHAAFPNDVTIACNLITALTEQGDIAGALSVCTPSLADGDRSFRLWRMRGYLLQQSEQFAAAADAYRCVVREAEDDFESWNNLGNACAGAGDLEGSVQALRRAVALRPDVAPVRINLAATLVAAEQWDEAIDVLQAMASEFPGDAKPLIELCALFKQLARDPEALDALEEAVRRDAGDSDLQVKLGVERIIGWQMDAAGDAFRNAIKLDPSHRDAHVLLGVLLEHTNRSEEFPALIELAKRNDIQSGAIDFIRALQLRRERRFAEGLVALKTVPDDVEPIRRLQLAGQFHDRLGDVDAAFTAFAEMNRIQMEDPSQPLRRAAEYREALTVDRSIVTPDWYESWIPFVPDDEFTSPVFLVGFPRSGTTLLDTMLMGHPDVQVMEELPPLTRVEQELGSIERLAKLDHDAVSALRRTYFDNVDQLIDRRPGALLVDKFPLHLNKVPIIHRLFPDARFILAMRHPCDVLLSCYITNFRLNNAMVNFLDLDTAAWVYDQTFAFWKQSSLLMRISLHQVTYEGMVADTAGELRPLFDFLDLDWHESALDHQRTAAERGTISTASYSQVTEPIYARSAGRWQRYRRQLAPILPVLKPWISQYGYDD
ncbi:MAG: sulfotransferase [Sphingomonas sp.]|uniref:tetratricopeptide repeat-containing sulfotransferase family protein n=1 Tax=Sphingomonas sp. TaxID=28214 RepID=UPI001AC05B9E|nr:tetratricopeptide repeat-containing sulfotransferase family protein [Sphingomonas sp.]MBN8806725.1 sulfotransferase [Sphingomonas sp.]